jgi:hypothetical protein
VAAYPAADVDLANRVADQLAPETTKGALVKEALVVARTQKIGRSGVTLLELVLSL